MNFKELKHHFIQEIKPNYGEEEASFIFYIALEYLTNWGRNEFIRLTNEPVEEAKELAFKNIISELKSGRPIQYIIGETIFYGLNFKVTPAVLIPRPETEELVEWVLHKTNDAKGLLNVLDIGTGSGCIAITLKKYNKNMEVFAFDVSHDALAIAEENAGLNDVQVNFIEADILNYSSHNTYDVIVSNPPYIKEEEKADMHTNVLNYEPHLALFVEDSRPLMFYIAIADFAKKNLRQDGYLFFEINEFLPLETMDMLSDKGFKNIELKKDMQGKSRMICCRLN